MIEVGTKINSWTYLGEASNGKRGYGSFQCECGTIKDVLIANIVTQKSKSCRNCKWNAIGISEKDYQYLVSVRARAIRRCYYEKDASFNNYSRRGIKVCDEWLKSSDAFVRWAIENGWERGLTLDRVDNDKGYSPDNCRWTTWKKQANNRSSNVYITHNGETKSLTEWADSFSIPSYLAYNRWVRGERNFDELFANVDKRRKVYA